MIHKERVGFIVYAIHSLYMGDTLRLVHIIKAVCKYCAVSLITGTCARDSQKYGGVHTNHGSHLKYGLHFRRGSHIKHGLHAFRGSQQKLGLHAFRGSQVCDGFVVFNSVHFAKSRALVHGIHRL